MSEREQFEAWAKEFSPETPLWQDNCGQYVYWSSEWTAWQAARAQPAQAEAVPPTHVLVPVEPTPEMLQAADKEHASRNLVSIALISYRAMLEAAPQQKGGE